MPHCITNPKTKSNECVHCMLKDAPDCLAKCDLPRTALMVCPDADDPLTQGNLVNAIVDFTDINSASGDITEIIIHSGSYSGQNNVIVGVQFSYAGQQADLHGRTGDDNTTCTFDTANGVVVTEVFGTARNEGCEKGSPLSMIYSLGFSTEETSPANCSLGNNLAGVFF